MLEFSFTNFTIENASQSGRAQLNGGIESPAIDRFAGRKSRSRRGHQPLSVIGIAQRELRAKRPAMEAQRQGNTWIQVHTAQKVRRAERRFAAREPFGCEIKSSI